jgi:hypothetical protein
VSRVRVEVDVKSRFDVDFGERSRWDGVMRSQKVESKPEGRGSGQGDINTSVYTKKSDKRISAESRFVFRINTTKPECHDGLTNPGKKRAGYPSPCLFSPTKHERGSVPVQSSPVQFNPAAIRREYKSRAKGNGIGNKQVIDRESALLAFPTDHKRLDSSQ